MVDSYFILKVEKVTRLGRMELKPGDEFVVKQVSVNDYVIYGNMPPFIVSKHEFEKTCKLEELIPYSKLIYLYEKKQKAHFDQMYKLAMSKKNPPKPTQVYVNTNKRTVAVKFEDETLAKAKDTCGTGNFDPRIGLIYALAKRMAGSWTELEIMFDKFDL